MWIEHDEIPDTSIKLDKLMSDLWDRMDSFSYRADVNNEGLKVSQYWSVFYKDSSERIYIPLDDEMQVSPEYNEGFKEESSRFMCVVERVWWSSSWLRVHIYDKAISGDLNEDSRIVSIEPRRHENRENWKYIIEAKKDDSENIDKVLKSVYTYFWSYRSEHDRKKESEFKEELIILEVEDSKNEEDPEDILKQLQSL